MDTMQNSRKTFEVKKLTDFQRMVELLNTSAAFKMRVDKQGLLKRTALNLLTLPTIQQKLMKKDVVKGMHQKSNDAQLVIDLVDNYANLYYKKKAFDVVVEAPLENEHA